MVTPRKNSSSDSYDIEKLVAAETRREQDELMGFYDDEPTELDILFSDIHDDDGSSFDEDVPFYDA